MLRSSIRLGAVCTAAAAVLLVAEPGDAADGRVKGLVCAPPAEPGVMRPEQLCAFTAAPPGDPFPNHDQVYSTPVVFRADTSGGGPRRSFIAAVFSAAVENNYREDDGVLRILRASDCTVVATLGGGARAMVTTFNVAAADLDADGNAELVTAGASGSTIAWTAVDGVWQPTPLWEAPLSPGAGWSACNGATGRCAKSWGGFSVHDLDDDGMPEIIREGTVLAANGAPRSLPPAGYGDAGATDSSLLVGHIPMLADLDDDGLIELTDGNGMWEWTAQPLPGWTPQPGFATGAAGAGHVGIGNVLPDGGAAASPELVLVRRSQLQLLAVDGSDRGVTAFPVAGQATAPVVADVDGDGLLEVAFNNQTAITLFDPDCTASPRSGGSCPQGPCTGGDCPGGIAWSRPVQDQASGRTNAIAFDFEGDGASEVVFADECFTRGFDATGDVVFSRHRSSCTWAESPVVAAIEDAPGRAALVVPSNTACGPIGSGLACPAIDPLYQGQACTQDGDCPGGSCDAGLCRCTSSAECCSAGTSGACEAAGYSCGVPTQPVPGSGMTCLSTRPGGSAGIAIHTDPRWTRARPIWNQPGFAVTNVDDEGTVPRSSEWQPNWQLDTDSYRSTPSLGQPCLPILVFADGFEA